MNRVFILGKPLKEKVIKERNAPTRGQMAQFFGRQFQKNIKYQAAALQSRWLPRYDQQNLLQESTSFIYSLNSIFELVDQLKAKIRKHERTQVDFAADRLKQFELYVKSLNMNDLNDTTNFIEALIEVINETKNYIFQFNIVCDCFTNEHSPPFKPTDRAKKHAFLKAVIAYEETHKIHKFPPLKSKALAGLNLPERTYGLWKKQLEAGTLHHFVQPRRIRQ